MNRVKLWVYVVLAIASGTLFFRASSIDAVTRATAGVDRRLTVASAHAAFALQSLDGRAAAMAALVAGDPWLERAVAVAAAPLTPTSGKRPQALPPADEAKREDGRLVAARAAAKTAAAAVGVSGDTRFEVWVAAASDFADGTKGDPAVWELLRGAASGKARAGRVVLDELAWTVAAAPTADGGAVAVALPLDAAWAGAVARATGAEVTLAVPGTKPLTTARPEDAGVIADAGARAPGALADAGRFAPVPIALPVALPLPPAPMLFGTAPAARVFALPLEGLKSAQLVLSVATRAELVPLVREQWNGVAGLGALLVLGLLFGLLVRGEVAAQLPADLVSAAARIAQGEFDARAPSLAGKLGTIAAALNQAAEAAEKTAAAQPAAPFHLPPLPAEAEPNAFVFPPRAAAPADPFAGDSAPAPASAFRSPPALPAEPAFAAAPAFPSASALPAEPAFASDPGPIAAPRPTGASALFGGAFEAAPVRAPAVPSPQSASFTAPLTTPADLLHDAAQTAAPEAAAGSDDDHFHEVFEDFLRVRRECGEAADGFTFERFRTKLEKNRDQLVTKYACKTVRFQVYVKEGKAALKATPVR